MSRPLAGAIWGLILGIAIAVVLQQQGIWPLDQITVFLLPGAVGLIGVVITTVGRSGSAVTLTIAVVITGAATAYGAIGLGELGAHGYLDGGCTVDAFSDVDDTTVDDTSKGDPFVIDPDGGLFWIAMSPEVFDDYEWEIWVDVGGFPWIIDYVEEQNNDGGSQTNSGDVANVTLAAEEEGIPIGQLRGVFEVGGFAATCEGLAFVTLEADLLETIIAKVAAAIAALALIMLLRAALSGRLGGGSPAPANGGGGLPGDANLDGNVDLSDFTASGSAGAAAGGFGSGDVDGDGDVDIQDFTSLGGGNGGDGSGEPGAEDLPKPDDLT